MTPIIASIIAELFKLGTDLWRKHANKPPGWEPTDADWAELEAQSSKTSEQYKAEAAGFAAKQRENE